MQLSKLPPKHLKSGNVANAISPIVFLKTATEKDRKDPGSYTRTAAILFYGVRFMSTERELLHVIIHILTLSEWHHVH